MTDENIYCSICGFAFNASCSLYHRHFFHSKIGHWLRKKKQKFKKYFSV